MGAIVMVMSSRGMSIGMPASIMPQTSVGASVMFVMMMVKISCPQMPVTTVMMMITRMMIEKMARFFVMQNARIHSDAFYTEFVQRAIAI